MTLFEHGDLATIIAIFAILTGVIQVFLLLGMALKGGTVTLWWGVISAALWTWYVLLV